MAIPRVLPRGGTDIALPEPLPPSEAVHVQRVFALQDRGELEAADQELGELTDLTLLGHILADRYLGQFHKATTDELSGWLARYAELPEAPAIYALLLRRLPNGAEAPNPPQSDTLASDAIPEPVPEDADPRDRTIGRNPSLDRTVKARAAAGNDRSALSLIAHTKGLSASYAELLRAEVAQALFVQNRDADALDMAGRAMQRTSATDQVGLAGYIAGLAAWRLDFPELARSFFEAAWQAPIASPATRAGAAFWAARANLRTHEPSGYMPWMRRAAQEQRTFYGLLARRALGLGFGLDGEREMLGEADVDAVAATPEGKRAFALLQVGEPDLAEAELRHLWPATKDNAPLGHAVLLIASRAGLTDLAAQLAALAQRADGRPRDYLRFPVPRLRPAGGFRVDPALVYALTRVESNFNAAAVSAAGARGLMQIMPVTAVYIAQDPSIARRAGRLHDPALNLDLGQRYVSHLAGLDTVDGNLIRLLASYNSGPGNFAHWSGGIRDAGDPLLFIESIPVAETRNFVQHVLTYTWIYAARLHLPAPSLDELAAGVFPRFTGLEKPGTLTVGAPRLR